MAEAVRYTISGAGNWRQKFPMLVNRLDRDQMEWYARLAERNLRRSVLIGIYGLLLLCFGLSFKPLLNWAVSHELAKPLSSTLSGESAILLAALPWVLIGLYVFCQAFRYLVQSRAHIKQIEAMKAVKKETSAAGGE